MNLYSNNNSRCYRTDSNRHEYRHYDNQQNNYHNNYHSYNTHDNYRYHQQQQVSNNYSYNNNNNQYNTPQNRYNSNSKYGSNNHYVERNQIKYPASSKQQYTHKKQVKSHQIISIKTETLISKRRDIKDPVFYDPESEIAQKCNNLRLNINKSMFEEEEKQKLLHIQQCNLIRDYNDNLSRNDGVDSDGFPVTPSGSEQDDDGNGNDECDADKKGSVRWPSMKDTTMRSIMDYTRDFALNDENGRNLLKNDNKHRLEDYGIYDTAGIDKQCRMIPKYVAMDGDDLIDGARIINDAEKTKKNGNGNRNGNGRKKGKRRRGGKGKRNRNRNRMNKEEMDCNDCKEVVAYIDRAKKNVNAQYQPRGVSNK